LNTILGQVLIYLLLIMEFGGLRVKIHTDPSSKLGSPPPSSTTVFPLLVSPTTPDLPPFVISEEDPVMKTWGQEDHNYEDDERLKV